MSISLSIKCKCGFEHKDSSNLIIKMDPLDHKHYYCKECGRALILRTLKPNEFKKIYRSLLNYK